MAGDAPARGSDASGHASDAPGRGSEPPGRASDASGRASDAPAQGELDGPADLDALADPDARSDWRDFGSLPLEPLLQSVLDGFVEQGYHGSTTRTLAARAGLSVPGLYHHYPSKQALLVEIMQRAMDDLYVRSLGAYAEADGSTLARLRLHIECLVLFHAHRGPLAFVAATEIRSLEPGERALHVARRDRQQQLLDDIVRQGVAEGLVTAPFPHDATRAIITMCTGVAQWYSPVGSTSPEELAARYVALALRALGAPNTPDALNTPTAPTQAPPS